MESGASPSKLFLDVLLSLSRHQSIEATEATVAVREAVLAFGSETQDNALAALNLDVRRRNDGGHGLAVTGGPMLADLANQLEACAVPADLREAFPDLTQQQWEAFTRLVTLVLVAFEDAQPSSASTPS